MASSGFSHSGKSWGKSFPSWRPLCLQCWRLLSPLQTLLQAKLKGKTCFHSINTQAFFTHNIILAMFGGTFGIVLCDSVHAGVSKTVLKLRCI